MGKPIEEMSDEELEAEQRRADGESGDHEDADPDHEDPNAQHQQQHDQGTGGDTTTGSTQSQQQDTTTASTQQAEAQSGAVAEPGKVAGVASKDGARILPYSALQAERRSHRQAAARAERAEKEVERLKKERDDLRAGRSTDSGELTEEEVQRMEADFPEVGAKMRKVLEQNQELARRAAEAAKATEAEDDADDPVQEAIDQVPLLAVWQYDPQHADKWERAIAIDNALKDSPKWKDKPAVDRFSHVARMVAEEFDLEVPQDSSTTQPKPSSTTQAKPDPKKVADSAERTPPSTLSDLKGGSVPDHGQVDMNRMSPQRMLARFQDMSDDEIDAQLAKLG